MLRLLATIAVALAPPATTMAADLRIETRVYAADDERPINESVTCFHGGVVYDFRAAESRVTVYRGPVGEKPARFLLLDTEREIQTEIKASQIASTMSKLRRWAAAQTDPFLQFTGAPQFDESYDAETGELKLTSEQLSYRLVTTPVKHEELKLELRSFLDAFAQLHTLLEAGLPPEPRLRVNEALFRRGVIPVEVELTARDDEEPGLRGEHDIAWVLSRRDRLKIDQVADQLASFTRVSNADFQRSRKQVAAK